MSTSTEIFRIQSARNAIRGKMVELGLSDSSAKLDTLAAAISQINNHGSVSVQIQEGDTYTIPKGYHNGSGTVSGVSGGGNYNLQSKKIIPTKNIQSITPDSGYFALSDVTVDPIPENYCDISGVTAKSAHVLSNQVFVDSSGETVAGSMPNNGTVNAFIDGLEVSSYSLPSGYLSGGTISLTDDIETALSSI